MQKNLQVQDSNHKYPQIKAVNRKIPFHRTSLDLQLDKSPVTIKIRKTKSHHFNWAEIPPASPNPANNENGNKVRRLKSFNLRDDNLELDLMKKANSSSKKIYQIRSIQANLAKWSLPASPSKTAIPTWEKEQQPSDSKNNKDSGEGNQKSVKIQKLNWITKIVSNDQKKNTNLQNWFEEAEIDEEKKTEKLLQALNIYFN
ncbi:unnamed protein product [Blepharisma stoltei]|uniref:Uncharacterized protein n=1 Tax=Blepharisma stoltei TaxID=1481888 RepID=A0AAU9JLF2_9CILI|nr:unnamed protein product [Blepharisma stoltei]